MYSSVHAAAGTSIVVTGYAIGGAEALPVAFAVAVVSHYAVDLLGEKPYGDLKESAIWELVPMAIFGVCAYLSGFWWLFALGWFAGNLFDIIDKKLYLAMVFPKYIHPWYIFHENRPLIKLDLQTTKLYAFMAVISYIMMALIVGSYF